MEGIKTAFGEADTREAARRRIKAMTQTGTVSEYWTKFQSDMNALKWDNQALYDEFYDGLSPEIRKGLASILDKPTDIREFAQLCVRLDNEMRADQSRNTKFSKRSTEKSQVTQAWEPRTTWRAPITTTQELPPPDPMDLDAGQRRRYGPLSEAEKARRRRQNLCLYCGKPGHVAMNCPISGKNSRWRSTRKRIAGTEEWEEVPAGKEQDQE